MGSGRGWLAGDWPSTGGILNTGGVLATKSERKMLASICLYSLYAWLNFVYSFERMAKLCFSQSKSQVVNRPFIFAARRIAYAYA